jgi:hypothetical protein
MLLFRLLVVVVCRSAVEAVGSSRLGLGLAAGGHDQ